MKNSEIARIFEDIADILEYKNIQWKPRAYRTAAAAIENLSGDIEKYRENFEKIPGVGNHLSKKIEEYLKTGKIKSYEKLKKEVPKGISDLLKIQGLGPKWIKRLNKKLDISTVSQLETAAKSHKIRDLEGFGEKSEENILRSIEIFRGSRERMLIGVAWPIANHIVEELRKLKEVENVKYAGSLIRMKETIGDIDILVSSKDPKSVMKYFTSVSNVKRILASGKTKSSIITSANIQVDLRVVEPKSWGAALQYFTGSKEHGIEIRKIAIKKGYKLNEYGLFKNEKQIAGSTEEGIYKKLGFKQTPPPELRENRGEIQAAKLGKIPQLINYKDIKGDLHIHTKWSDGLKSIKEMAIAAKNFGHEYIAITDHSPTTAIANGLNKEELLEQIKMVKKINKEIRGIRVLCGSEVDILSDSSLDFPDSILKKLDIVNASIHSGFKSDKKKMTNRILTAMENKYIDILSHPTGRILGKRDPYKINLEEVFVLAKDRKIHLEINSQAARLDLKDVLIRDAIKAGVKLVISTDSHNINQLNFMRFGIAQARRGWAQKKDIINTRNYEQFRKFFKKLN